VTELAPQVLLGGEPWRAVADLPRPIAESYRRALRDAGVPAMLRTPFQWVLETPVIEIETGGYQGMVGLYVPETHLAVAFAVIERLEGTDAGPDDAADDGVME
jgi:hypothetical protein